MFQIITFKTKPSPPFSISIRSDENDYLYTDAPVPGNPNANNVRAYERKYSYDKLGNVQQMKQLGTNGFTRNFSYNAAHNTLQKVETATPTLIEDFTYDACGNQLTAGTTRHYVWNAANQLITYYNQAGSADPTIFAQYDYAGQNRVSKLVRTGTSSSPIYERTVYIDGIFEYHILENGTTYEKNEIHIMDDKSRIAMVRVGTPFPNDITNAITYNVENQIGSSVARLDANGTVIDKEEYYPFGDSSLRTFTKKCYRYVGKEKDLESGLYYYGARYYAAWTCRFVSVDPLSAKYAQLSPYNYADNNPINDYDIDGMQTASSVESQQSGPVKNPLPVAKDANGNTITNQETGEAIRPSVNAVEVKAHKNFWDKLRGVIHKINTGIKKAFQKVGEIIQAVGEKIGEGLKIMDSAIRTVLQKADNWVKSNRGNTTDKGVEVAFGIHIEGKEGDQDKPVAQDYSKNIIGSMSKEDLDLLRKSQSLSQPNPSSKPENFIEKIEYAKKNMENGAEIGEEIDKIESKQVNNDLKRRSLPSTYQTTKELYITVWEIHKMAHFPIQYGPYKNVNEFLEIFPYAKKVNGYWHIDKR